MLTYEYEEWFINALRWFEVYGMLLGTVYLFGKHPCEESDHGDMGSVLLMRSWKFWAVNYTLVLLEFGSIIWAGHSSDIFISENSKNFCISSHLGTQNHDWIQSLFVNMQYVANYKRNIEKSSFNGSSNYETKQLFRKFKFLLEELQTTENAFQVLWEWWKDLPANFPCL